MEEVVVVEVVVAVEEAHRAEPAVDVERLASMAICSKWREWGEI